MNNINNELSQSLQSSEIDIGRIFRLLLMQSKLILFVVFLVFCVTTYIYINSDKIYNIKSTLQVFGSQSSNIGGDMSVDFILGSSNRYDITNLLYLYKTRSNLLEIVDTLDLDIEIEDQEITEVEIKSFRNKFDNSSDLSKKYFIKFGEDTFAVYDKDKKLLESSSYDRALDTDYFSLEISSANKNDDLYLMTIYNPDEVYKIYESRLKLSSSIQSNNFWSSNGIIEVSYNTSNEELGKNIINLANNIFIQNNIEIEKEKASKAIGFIDDRIESIEKVLSINKSQLNKFQKENASLNVDLEIKSIIETISSIDLKISETDLEIAKIENTYTLDNPFYQKLINQKEALQSQKSTVESKVRNLPIAQQRFIDLYRDVEVSQEIYSELINQKLGFSIMEASTLGNIRIIDEAYKSFLVGPKPIFVIASCLIALLLSSIIAVIRGVYFLAISNPAEVNDHGITIPILGVFPKFDDHVQNSDELDLRSITALESTVVNIKTVLNQNTHKSQLILITSPTANNGKSISSRLLSRKFAEVGNKVLLLDLDLKRGNQHKEFNRKPISRQKFESIDQSNIESFMIDENLYFIPKISGLNNSFELIYSELFNSKLDIFKNIFDIILLDTAPILSVSDTQILMSRDDIVNLAICRHGVTKIRELQQIDFISNQIGSNFSGIIYNAYEKPSSYYGYYGLYGNYNYQYYAQKYLYESYEYEDRK